MKVYSDLAEARVCIVPVAAKSGVSGNIATEWETLGGEINV